MSRLLGKLFYFRQTRLYAGIAEPEAVEYTAAEPGNYGAFVPPARLQRQGLGCYKPKARVPRKPE
jgi:hypothetical protein